MESLNFECIILHTLKYSPAMLPSERLSNMGYIPQHVSYHYLELLLNETVLLRGSCSVVMQEPWSLYNKYYFSVSTCSNSQLLIHVYEH